MKDTKVNVLKLELLSIEGDGYHLYVEAEINGQPANLLVDTGASKTVFDSTRITQYTGENTLLEMDKLSTGLGTDSMPGHLIEIDEIRLGTTTITDYKGLALDLSHVNASYKKMGIAPIDGVLGSDILQEYNALIDYKNKRLVLG